MPLSGGCFFCWRHPPAGRGQSSETHWEICNITKLHWGSRGSKSRNSRSKSRNTGLGRGQGIQSYKLFPPLSPPWIISWGESPLPKIALRAQWASFSIYLVLHQGRIHPLLTGPVCVAYYRLSLHRNYSWLVAWTASQAIGPSLATQSTGPRCQSQEVTLIFWTRQHRRRFINLKTIQIAGACHLEQNSELQWNLYGLIKRV